MTSDKAVPSRAETSSPMPTPRRTPQPPVVTVHLDTSVIVDALTGPRRSLGGLAALVEAGHRLAISTLVLYEWLRGPRARSELLALEELLPRETAVPFGPAEADRAARLYRRVRRARGRELDLAVAACALEADAALWTLNRADFDDIPYLALKGDYTATSAQCRETVDAINARRVQKQGTAKAEYLKLDDMGILGVTHMMMLDKKNLEIADIMLNWVNKNVKKR